MKKKLLIIICSMFLLSNCSEEQKTEYIDYLCVDTSRTQGMGTWFGTGNPFTIIKSEYGIRTTTGGGFKFDENLSTNYNYVSIQKVKSVTTTLVFNTITESGSIDIVFNPSDMGRSGKINFSCKKK